MRQQSNFEKYQSARTSMGLADPVPANQSIAWETCGADTRAALCHLGGISISNKNLNWQLIKPEQRAKILRRAVQFLPKIQLLCKGVDSGES